MELVLYNFKCYIGEKTIFIDSEGLTLITGASGLGKSTLLGAIVYAIQGEGTRVVPEGETTCWVKLCWNDLMIRRSTRPNRLVLTIDGAEHEDDEAQARIYNYFGPHFGTINYIPQNPYKTFLFRSPAEKLDILETLIFSSREEQPNVFKKRCMDRVKDLTSCADVLLGKADVLQKQASMYTLDPTEMSFIDKALDETSISRRRSFLYNKQRIYDSYSQKVSLLRTEIQTIERGLSPESEVVSSSLSSDKLQRHIIALEQLGSFDWKKYTEFTVDDCIQTIEEYQEDIAKAKEHARLTSSINRLKYNPAELDNLDISISILEQVAEAFYECPECHGSLSLVNGTLVCAFGDPSKSLETAKKNQKLQSLRIERNELVRKRDEVSRLTTVLKKIEVPEDPIPVLEEQLAKWREYRACAEKVAKFKHLLLEEDITLSDARAILDGRETHAHQSRLRARLDELREDLRALEEQAKSQDLTDSRIELSCLEKQMASWALRNKMISERETQIKILNELHGTKTELQKLDKRLFATRTLKTLITTVEMRCLAQTIFSIEVLVNQYCSELFVDSPLVAKVKLFIESKTQGTKPQVDIEIYYKNRKHTFGELSGGEQARLNICFILAFSKYFKSKLLLLDECTAHLNQEETYRIFDLLSQNVQCKVVMVEHEVVQGVFNQVIDL